MRRYIGKLLTVTILSSAIAPVLQAQGLLRQAIEQSEELRRQYRFAESVKVCEEAIDANSSAVELDTLLFIKLEESLNLARNGESMLRFCGNPRVLAKKRFSLKEFFLHYPGFDGKWVMAPNVFSDKDTPLHSTYFPSGSASVYFARSEEDGSTNIYYSERGDSVWTTPHIVDEALTSSTDDIFPVISNDGKTLYFTSNGFYGVGGYDLYVSKWNEFTNSWGTAENLGFPYSSPYNDYLFVNTPDGRYSVFASDRECPDSGDVYVYVLEYDSMPVRRAVSDVAELANLCRLDLSGADAEKTEDSADNSENDEYILQYERVGEMKARIESRQSLLDESRKALTGMSAEERDDVAKKIMAEELEMAEMQAKLRQASEALRKIEMSMIHRGQMLVLASQTSTVSMAPVSFTFTKSHLADNPSISFMKPKVLFDYSFMILPEGRFAEDNTLPAGLVYQIQIFSKSAGEAKVSDLKGLSPVFSTRDKTGKVTYYVGLFRSYNDVLANLNKVKKAGFRTAFIVAFRDGEKMNVQEARKLEKSIVVNYQIIISPLSGRLSDSDLTKIKSATTKDMTREILDGRTVYVLGTYSGIDEANEVLSELRSAGVGELTLKTLL